MAELTVSVPVDAPPEVVWRAAMDWERQGEWMLATRVRLTAGDGVSVGSRVKAVTGVGSLGVPDPMEIVEWDPPRRCVVRHKGSVLRGTGVFAVAPRAGGCVFSWTERLDLPLGALGRAGWPAVRPLMALGLGYSLRRFAGRYVGRPPR